MLNCEHQQFSQRTNKSNDYSNISKATLQLCADHNQVRSLGTNIRWFAAVCMVQDCTQETKKHSCNVCLCLSDAQERGWQLPSCAAKHSQRCLLLLRIMKPASVNAAVRTIVTRATNSRAGTLAMMSWLPSAWNVSSTR